MPAPVSEEQRTALRRGLSRGLPLADAADEANLSHSTAKRLKREDSEYGQELRDIFANNAPRKRARAGRAKAARSTLRSVPQPTNIVAELVADADHELGGPKLAEWMQRAWEVFNDEGAPDTLRRACFDAAIKIRAAPVMAELARQGNATPIEQGVPRARLVLPDKDAPPA